MVEKPHNIQHNVKEGYYKSKLVTFRKYVNILIMAFALFNLLLLIPDLMLVKSEISRIAIALLRGGFSLGIVGIGRVIKKVNSYYAFSRLVTGGELAAVAVYIYVLTQYDHPSFLIQAMGMEMLILAAYLIPNRWKNMLLVAVIGSSAFFITVFVKLETVNPVELGAALVYILTTVLLFTAYTVKMENMQLNEFAIKRQLELMSSTDYLTDTANRFKLEAEASRWINTCRNQALPLSLVFIDVDNLKAINDQYGHCAGDRVLASLAGLFQAQLRSSDILARWGGDEFVILLPKVTEENANAIVTRIQNHISMLTLLNGITATCSFGVVGMREDMDFQALIREADALMYEKKKVRSR